MPIKLAFIKSNMNRVNHMGTVWYFVKVIGAICKKYDLSEYGIPDSGFIPNGFAAVYSEIRPYNSNDVEHITAIIKNVTI